MISTKGRYALRVMIDPAENGGDGYTPLKGHFHFLLLLNISIFSDSINLRFTLSGVKISLDQKIICKNLQQICQFYEVV